MSSSYHYTLPHSLMWTHSTGVKFISLQLATLPNVNTFNRCQIYIITTCYTRYSEHIQQVSSSYHYTLEHSIFWIHATSVSFITLHLATLPKVNTFDRCLVHIITPCHTPYSEHIQQVSSSYHYNLAHSMLAWQKIVLAYQTELYHVNRDRYDELEIEHM